MEKGISFLVFGVGAIGTYVGASLCASGQKVTFIERSEVAREVVEKGLVLRIADKLIEEKHPVVVSSVAEALALGRYDVAILAVKSFDTPAILGAIRPHAEKFPPILCLQNGVENEIFLREILRNEMVIPGTVTTAVGRVRAGEVEVEKLRGIGIVAGFPISDRLVACFTEAGLRPRGYKQASGMKWSKLLTNLLANASSAILNMTPAQIFTHPGLYQVEMNMFKEALAVMKKLNYPVVDLPATPVRLLTGIIRSFPVNLSRLILSQALGKGRGGKMPSFHIDLHSGRGQSEVGFLNGAVVRFGEEAGIATPVNRWMTRVLMMLTNGELPRDHFAGNPQKYLAWLADNLP